MNTPAPGEVLLGKYRVEKCLGKGGMGVVVAVRHLHLGELYALKLLLPSGIGSAQAVERFSREARAAARLKSEHVARVHDLGTLESGAPYMVMEYLDGCDLKAALRGKGALPVDDVLLYMLQACEAVAEAHAAGIIHRDIKCSNLFLSARPGGAPCLKVLDWGVSKHTGVTEVELTEASMIIGSPLYMSPEQVTHSKRVDARADIWSLGVVLYELLTAASPFVANTTMEVFLRVLQEEPESPRRLRPDLPVSLEEIVMRCLRKRPEQRFQRVEDLATELRKAQEEIARAKALGEATTEIAAPWSGAFHRTKEQESGGDTNASERVDAASDSAPQRSSLTGSSLGTTGMVRRQGQSDRGGVGIRVMAAGVIALGLIHVFMPGSTAQTAPSAPSPALESAPPPPQVLPSPSAAPNEPPQANANAEQGDAPAPPQPSSTAHATRETPPLLALPRPNANKKAPQPARAPTARFPPAKPGGWTQPQRKQPSPPRTEASGKAPKQRFPKI